MPLMSSRVIAAMGDGLFYAYDDESPAAGLLHEVVAELRRAEKLDAEMEQLAKDRYAEACRADEAERKLRTVERRFAALKALYDSTSKLFEKSDARAERLADYVRADLALTAATLGDGSNREVAEKNERRIEALAAINAHRDLEGEAI